VTQSAVPLGSVKCTQTENLVQTASGGWNSARPEALFQKQFSGVLC